MGTIQINALEKATLPVDLTDLMHMKQGIIDKRCTVADVLFPHTSRTDNPHNVTKFQLQLGNVTNDAQFAISKNLAELTTPAAKAAARTNLDVYSKGESDAKVDSHANRRDNPHGVQKGQVGLGNVPNWTVSNSPNDNTDQFASAHSVYALLQAIKNVDATTGLAPRFDAKSNNGHHHSVADVDGLQAALNGKANASHNHSIAQVDGLQNALNGKANASHGHSMNDVSGLAAALNSKSPNGHHHTIDDIDGLRAALAGIGSSAHTHTIAQVTGLQGALDGKSNTNHNHDSRYSKLGHHHGIGEVDGLQGALNGKSNTDHNHDGRYAGVSHRHNWQDINGFDDRVRQLSGSKNVTYSMTALFDGSGGGTHNLGSSIDNFVEFEVMLTDAGVGATYTRFTRRNVYLNQPIAIGPMGSDTHHVILTFLSPTTIKLDYQHGGGSIRLEGINWRTS